MKFIIKKRREVTVSQRQLALLAGVSFRTVQLIESGKHDAKLSSLSSIADSLGYPPKIITSGIENIFSQPPDSVEMISKRILTEGKASWKLWLFNFVDAFRKHKDIAYILMPPSQRLPQNIYALLASAVETLCDELKIDIPWWCDAVNPLKEPWFVSNIEGLKAAGLLESPIHFRKRNIFVLGNFLSRG